MTAWWPARRMVAILALVAGVATAAGAAVLAGGASLAFGAVVYVALVALALYAPAAILLQVIGGQILAGSLLLRPGADPLWLVPIVAGVVVTAELLGVVARLDAPIERAPVDDLRRAGLSAVIGGAVFALVALADELPGPSGIVAIGLASAACAALAVVLIRNAQAREGEGEG